MQLYQFEKIYSQMEKEFGKIKKVKKEIILCSYFQVNGYFNFIESCIGSQIKGTEMEFSVLSTGLMNV